jgi:hypothetical protein
MREPLQLQHYRQIRHRLQQSNPCIVSASEDLTSAPPNLLSAAFSTFPLASVSTVSTLPSAALSSSFYQHPHHLQQHQSAAAVATDYSSDGTHDQQPSETLDCMHYFGGKIPLFMAIPAFIRVYKNDSGGCSDICQCIHNNKTTVCRALPCGPNISCKIQDVIYVHGSSFTMSSRGQCRCIDGELICAKSPFSMTPQQAGLFLHIGYSLKDTMVVEANSPVRFQPESVAKKLGTLLNEDSAEQFCRMTVHDHHEDGNLVLNINVSKYSVMSTPENCIRPSKTLSYMINSRHSAIISDVELSVLKVSFLERVRFHDASPGDTHHQLSHASASSRERKGASVASCISQKTVALSVSVVLTIVTWCSVICGNFRWCADRR